MKILLLLSIIVLIGAIVAVRYRKQIRLAVYFLRMLNKMRQSGKENQRRIEPKEPLSADSALIQCTGCKNWVAQNKSIKIGQKSFYCTHACMEKSFKVSAV